MAEHGHYHATRYEDHQEHGRFSQPTPRELQNALWGNGRLASGEESQTCGRCHRRPGFDTLEARYFEALAPEGSVQLGASRVFSEA